MKKSLSIESKGFPGVDSPFIECVERLGGKSFSEGIYRVFSCSQIPKVTGQVEEVFVFACDWFGRYFAVDSRRTLSGSAEILMLETGWVKPCKSRLESVYSILKNS